MENNKILLITISGIVVLLNNLIYFIIRRRQGDSLKDIILPFILLVSIPLINISLLFFSKTLQNNEWIYSSIITAIFSGIFPLVLYLSRVKDKEVKNWIAFSLLGISLLIPIISSILIISTYKPSEQVNIVKYANTKILENSIYTVKGKFEEIEKIIKTESKTIDELFSKIKLELQLKNNNLEEMQLRETELIAQIEYYKGLSSLSEEQVESVMKALNQNSKMEMIISFIVGFFASLLVWILSQIQMVKRMFNKQ